MAISFPTTRGASGSSRLFPYSVAATLVAVGLPFASVILLNHVTGFEGVSPFFLALIAISTAILASALGTALWMEHPASNEVAFGDLMIWSWARSAQARRQLVRAFDRLADEEEVMSPHDRLLTLRELSAALDRKDPYTYGHSRRVERLAYRTGLALELSTRELHDLREAAAIHDVGKIYVPDDILLKEGPLTPEEYAVIKGHSAKGAEIVAFLNRPEITDTVRFHHERWDGKGYPDGVSGEDIPLLARIVGTVDAYDAMTSMRSYRASLGHKKAVEILKEERGKQFDAAIVDAFIPTLRNPLLAAITVPLLTGPIEALRRFLGWAEHNARLDVATAAGAVGMTVAISSSLVGGLGQPPRSAEAKLPPKVEVMGERVDKDTASAASSDADRGDAKNEEKQRSAKKENNGKNESKGKSEGKGKKLGHEKSHGDNGNHGRSNSAPAGAGSSSNGSAGSVASAPDKDPTDTSTTAGKSDHIFDPPVPGDPQPVKGTDCPGLSDSTGKSLHCDP